MTEQRKHRPLSDWLFGGALLGVFLSIITEPFRRGWREGTAIAKTPRVSTYPRGGPMCGKMAVRSEVGGQMFCGLESGHTQDHFYYLTYTRAESFWSGE